MKMGKRVFSAVLSVCLLLGGVPVNATEAKAEPEDNYEYIDDSFIDDESNPAPQSAASSSSATSGVCGDNLTWEFDESTGTLTISGTGEMNLWTNIVNNPPWYKLESYIKNIIINQGVTNIGRHAFRFCRNLTSILIPDSVKSVGMMAFNDCYNIRTVYYTGSQSQWNNLLSSMSIYNDYLIGADIIYDVKLDASILAKKGWYIIHVVNSSGKQLVGAEVSFDQQKEYTDFDGNSLFNISSIGVPLITVSLDGYRTWTNENSNWEKSESRYETVVLYSEAEGDYIITEALYSDSISMIAPCNLLVNTKTVSKYNLPPAVGGVDSGQFYVKCKAANGSNVSCYQLWQGDKMIAESSDGLFELFVDSFDDGGDCFIRVISSDGITVDTHINLQIDETQINEHSEITISEGKIKIPVGDDIPFVGGQTFEIELPEALPVDLEFGEDKIHIGINIIQPDDEEGWKEMKQTLEQIDKLRDLELNSSLQGKIDDLLKDQKKMTLPGTDSFDVYLLGYAEADCGSSEATGAMYLIVKAELFDYNNTFVVGVVPVTVQIEISAGTKLGIEVSYNWLDSTLDGGIDLDIELGLEAFGGVGVGDLTGVGAYGEAKLLTEMRLHGIDPGLQKIDLTGEMGLKVYFLLWSDEKPFAYNTWHLYTANNVRSASAAPLNTYGLLAASDFEIEALDYLVNESDWMGYPVSTFALGASTAFNTLLAGTYRNAQPAMISNGEQLYAAFLKADSNTNKISVAISVFNGSGWSEPIISDINGILDDGPQLMSTDGSVWLTYASTDASADSSSMVSYATNQTIVIGSLNSDGNFNEFNRYTPSGNTYAHMQTLAVVDGVPTLFWVESVINDADDIFSSTSNTVKYAIYSNGSWGNAQTLSTINHPIRQLTAGGGSVACNIDTDDDLNTTDDLQLTVYSISGSSSVIANGVTGNVTYGMLPGTSVEGFIWNGDSTLYCGSSSISAPGITNEYSIVGDSIYYSSNEEGGTVLTLLKYDGANWSEPISLISSADESRYLENLSAAELNGKDYIFGMNTAVDISADSVTPDKNLVWTSVNPVSDLKIDRVEYDTDVLTPGKDVPVTLTVVNGGDHAVSGLQVTVDGVIQDIGTIDLGVGESADITINIPCPNTETTFNISVTATSEPLADDFNPGDNSYQLILGLANLVANLTYEQIGTSRTLVAAVTNEGINPASGTVTFYDANDAAHGETTFSDLESGGVVVVRLPLADSFAGKYDGGDVSVTVTSEQSELYEFDNRATAHIYESTGTSITSVESSGSYVEAQVTYYGEQTDVTAYCAFYDAQGRVLSTEQQNIGVGSQSIRFSNVTDANTAKVFVLDAAHSPLCQAKEVTL